MPSQVGDGWQHWTLGTVRWDKEHIGLGFKSKAQPRIIPRTARARVKSEVFWLEA